MGFGHRVYRAEDPRARVLRRTAREIGAPRLEVAEKLEEAALAELKARKPDRVLATNVEFWSAVVLDFAEVPPDLFTPMFASARVGGWAAHIMEQKREGRLIRPSAKYVGPEPASGRRGERRRPRLMDARRRAPSAWCSWRRSWARPSSRSTRRSSTSRCRPSRTTSAAGSPGQQWTSNAYLLTLSSLLLVAGSLGDLFGARRVFALGVAGFGVTSVFCALAPTSSCSCWPARSRASSARCSRRRRSR